MSDALRLHLRLCYSLGVVREFHGRHVVARVDVEGVDSWAVVVDGDKGVSAAATDGGLADLLAFVYDRDGVVCRVVRKQSILWPPVDSD